MPLTFSPFFISGGCVRERSEIEIMEVRLMPPGRALRAFVDVKIDDLLIREFRVIKEDGKRVWVAPPQVSWKGQRGEIQYKTVVTFLNDELKGKIDLLVLNRFSEEMEKSNGKSKE